MIPTPTPLPDMSGVTPDIVLDGSQFTQDVAVSGVQWWNTINNGGYLTGVQIALIVIILLAGLMMIIRALQSDD